MSEYYAEVFARPYGGAWAVRDTPEAALKAARSTACNTARTERGSYVLEFPDGADPRIATDFGGWRANAHPLRVVSRNKIPARTTDNELLGRDQDGAQ
jgi:hypothetical protein